MYNGNAKKGTDNISTELFPSRAKGGSEMTEERRNVFFEACDKIIKEVVNIKTSAQGLGEEYRLRAELSRIKQENELLKRKLKKFKLKVPMYQMEIKGLKNELEREKKKAILAKGTSSKGNTEDSQREMMRQSLALRIERKRRRRSLSLILRSPINTSPSPLSPVDSPGGSIFTIKRMSNEM